MAADQWHLSKDRMSKLHEEHETRQPDTEGTVKFLAHFLTGEWPAVRYGYSSSSDTSR